MHNVEHLPALIEQYIDTREDRLRQERAAEVTKKAENKLKEEIEATLREAGLTVGGGAKYKATLVPKEKPVAENWSLIYAHIAKTGEFDLLQKRLTEGAVKLRWEEGTAIPGVTKFPVTELSITKV